MTTIVDALKKAAQWTFHGTGGLELVRWKNRRKLRILMYHRFADSAGLDRQCRYLRAQYSILSLDQIAHWLDADQQFPPNALAITADDGYRDFYESAFPVFSAHKIPVTLFLITGFLDRRLWVWTDIIPYLVWHTPRTHAEVPLTNTANTPMRLDSTIERIRWGRQLTERAKRMTNSERLELLAKLPDIFCVQLPTIPPDPFAPLTWNQVREMADKGIGFGAHTESHPILSKVSLEEARGEVMFSRQRIESELQKSVVHFCYPNGRAEDFTGQVIDVVKACGFKTAVTTEPGVNGREHDPFTLRRIGVEPGLPELYFRQCAAGFRV
jgi:peptidoglycan/xylan/chitin deacetylase (PgdA/CDA1 family)